jgi:hypothetical protein
MIPTPIDFFFLPYITKGMFTVKTIGKKHEVFKGTALKTSGGLMKHHLTKSKSGKIVSKKKQAAGRKLAKKFPPQLTQAPAFHS